jgi:hypothetical protein
MERKPAYVIDIILAGSRNNCSTDAHINFGQRRHIGLEVFHYLGVLGDNEKVARFAHYLCNLQTQADSSPVGISHDTAGLEGKPILKRS